MYRTKTVMFPKNHNDIIKVVFGEWEEKDKKGRTFVEINLLNAYVPKKFVEFKEHKSFESLIKEVKRLVEEINVENNNKPERMAFECETKMIATLYRRTGGEAENITFNSAPINIIEQDEDIQVSIYGSCDIKPRKYRYACVEVTNDPTPKMAGGVVSLGYYTWRIELNHLDLISSSPLVQIVGKVANFKHALCRPCRRVM